jgi:aerobic-type carbon monoxide dehydrogenase small subunit (CoxS/CutS family)
MLEKLMAIQEGRAAQTTLTVNGGAHTLQADPRMPLLWVLRDRLGMTGTKYGCGIGVCGACTVHLDGVAARSCVTPLGAVRDRAVTTIEGLAPDGDHPLQHAWAEHHVPQCGYCQAGQLMTAAALMRRSPAASDSEIIGEMDSVRCRCGTYGRILAAIRSVRDAG